MLILPGGVGARFAPDVYVRFRPGGEALFGSQKVPQKGWPYSPATSWCPVLLNQTRAQPNSANASNMAELHRVWSALLGWLEGRGRMRRHGACGFCFLVLPQFGCHTRPDLVSIVACCVAPRRA